MHDDSLFCPLLPDFRTRILTRFVYDSSYGQTLSTSTFIGETMFAILIAIFGLVLFAHLIGNMQVFEILCNFLCFWILITDMLRA